MDVEYVFALCLDICNQVGSHVLLLHMTAIDGPLLTLVSAWLMMVA